MKKEVVSTGIVGIVDFAIPSAKIQETKGWLLSLVFHLYIILKKFKVESYWERYFFFITFIITDIDSFKEIFYWNMGNWVYCFPMLLEMFKLKNSVISGVVDCK